MPLPLSRTAALTLVSPVATVKAMRPRRVLGRVVEQVDQHLDQARAVALDRHRLRRQVHRQRVAAFLDVRARLFHRRDRDLVQVKDLVFQFHQSARHARDVEQVVHQFRHVAHLARDDVAGLQTQAFAHFRQPQQLGGAGDRRQRIAQLVRQHRQELVLHLVVALGLGARRALARQDLLAFLGRALCDLDQARIVDRDRGLHGKGADQLLGAGIEHARLRVAEEQAADHLARARHHRRRQVAAHRQVAGRHAVVRPHLAIARVAHDVVAAHRGAAVEGRSEHRRGARLAEVFEGFARRTGQGVQQVGVAILVFAVVEEGAEFGADQLGRGVGDLLHQHLEVEGRSQRVAGLAHQGQYPRLGAQRIFGANAAQGFPDAARGVFQHAQLGLVPAPWRAVVQRHHRHQPPIVEHGHGDTGCDALRQPGAGIGDARVGRDLRRPHRGAGAQISGLAEAQGLERHHAVFRPAGLDAGLARAPLFPDQRGPGRRVDLGVDRAGAVGVGRDQPGGTAQQVLRAGLTAQNVGQFEPEALAPFGLHGEGGFDEGDQHALGLAGLVVDRAVGIVEIAGFGIAEALDGQRQAVRSDRLASLGGGPHRTDGRPDLRPGVARIAAQGRCPFVAENRQIGIVEELRVGVAPGQVHRQLAVQQGAHGKLQTEWPLRHGTDSGRFPRMGSHLQFHVAHRPHRCGIGDGEIKRPGHVVPFEGEPVPAQPLMITGIMNRQHAYVERVSGTVAKTATVPLGSPAWPLLAAANTCLLDHTAGDALAPAAQRGRLVGIVVAAGVDHEGLAFHVAQLGQARRRHRDAGTAIAAHHQRRQVAHVAVAGRSGMVLAGGWIVVAAGGPGRYRLAVLLVGTAAAGLVHVETVRAGRQVGQRRREHQAVLRFRDRHRTDHLAGTAGRRQAHRGLQLVRGLGQRAGRRSCRSCYKACQQSAGRSDVHVVSFQVVVSG
jgi:hypothetical protein